MMTPPMLCQARKVSAGASGRAKGHTSGAPTCGPSGPSQEPGGEHRGIVIPTGLVGSSRAERRRAGGTRRRDLRRDAEMSEDPLDHGRLFDERDQAQTAAAPGTREHVKPERACHQGRPTLAAGSTPSRLGGISLTSLLGGRVLHPRIAAVSGRLAPNHLSPPGRQGSQHAVIKNQVDALAVMIIVSSSG
jgi:hypothetical protein